MTIREELLHEIEQAPDSVLQALLTLLKLTMNQANPSMRVPSPDESSPGLQKHYPLRGLPLVIAEDFDAPMTDVWDSLES